MPVRVVTFDVGETLLRPYPGFGQIVVDSCQKAGEAIADGRAAELERLADLYFVQLRLRNENFSLSPQQSRRVWTDIYRGFLVAEGVHPGRVAYLTERIYQKFLDHSTYRLFDDVLPVLSALRDRGFRIGVISNWESWLPGLLQTTGLSVLLEFQIASGEVGYEKPDLRIFQSAIAATGVAPSSILHVGDSPTSDVEGARSAGLDAILLDRLNRYPAAVGRRVSSLNELLVLPELAN